MHQTPENLHAVPHAPEMNGDNRFNVQMLRAISPDMLAAFQGAKESNPPRSYFESNMDYVPRYTLNETPAEVDLEAPMVREGGYNIAAEFTLGNDNRFFVLDVRDSPQTSKTKWPFGLDSSGVGSKIEFLVIDASFNEKGEAVHGLKAIREGQTVGIGGNLHTDRFKYTESGKQNEAKIAFVDGKLTMRAANPGSKVTAQFNSPYAKSEAFNPGDNSEYVDYHEELARRRTEEDRQAREAHARRLTEREAQRRAEEQAAERVARRAVDEAYLEGLEDQVLAGRIRKIRSGFEDDVNVLDAQHIVEDIQRQRAEGKSDKRIMRHFNKLYHPDVAKDEDERVQNELKAMMINNSYTSEGDGKIQI